MIVHVGFQESNGCLVHKGIVLFSPKGNKIAHCEPILNGQGYTTKRYREDLYKRCNSEYDESWHIYDVSELINVDKAQKFIDQNELCKYDLLAIFRNLPVVGIFIREDPHKRSCNEFVGDFLSYCEFARNHGTDSTTLKPWEIEKMLIECGAKLVV